MAVKAYKPAEKAPESGVYLVTHLDHRDEHHVVMFREQEFPPCKHCKDNVRFRLLRAAQGKGERGS